MTTEMPASPTLTRRHVLLGGAAVTAIIAAGSAGIYLWSSTDTAAAETPAGAEVSMADLLVPGPLGDEIQGQADAPVTIVEYASMTCPHCSHFHETTYPEMKKKYIDTGKVRFIFREFPLDPLAAAAAMLARCAGKDKFFPTGRRLLCTAEGLGGAEAATADVRHRQASRLHPAELRRMPRESATAH
jgi:protein-disulfide isomerase